MAFEMLESPFLWTLSRFKPNIINHIASKSIHLSAKLRNKHEKLLKYMTGRISQPNRVWYEKQHILKIHQLVSMSQASPFDNRMFDQ